MVDGAVGKLAGVVVVDAEDVKLPLAVALPEADELPEEDGSGVICEVIVKMNVRVAVLSCLSGPRVAPVDMEVVV